MNEVMTDNRRYLNPKQYFSRIDFLEKQLEKMKYENRALKKSLAKYGRIEFHESKSRIDKVIEIISNHFNTDINNVCQKKEFTKGRRFFFYWARKNTTLSYQMIGSALDGKYGHSNVMTAIQTHENLMDTDKSYKKESDELLAFIDVHAPLEK